MCVCHIIFIWHPFSRNVGNRFNSDYEFCSGEAFTMKIITVWEELHRFTFDFHTLLSRQTKLHGSASWNAAAWTWDKTQPIRSTAADFRCPGQANVFPYTWPMPGACHAMVRYAVHRTNRALNAGSLKCLPLLVIPKRSDTAGTLQNATDSAEFPLLLNWLNWRQKP